MKIPTIPFKILVLAPFKVMGEKTWNDLPLRVEYDNLHQVMQQLDIAVYISLPKNLCPAGGIDICCNKPKDFHPDGIIQSNPFLKNLLEAEMFLNKAYSQGLSPEQIQEGLKQFPEIAPIKIESAIEKVSKSKKSAIDNLLDMVSMPGEVKEIHPAYAKGISQIQNNIRLVFNEIFSNEDFKTLDSVWRGLLFLLNQGDIGDQVHLEIVPVDWNNLQETLNKLTPCLIDNLPSLIVVDLPFDSTARSIELLEAIVDLSQTLLVPSVAWITPKFFYLDSWKEIKKLSYLPNLLDEPHFAKWQNLRRSPGARWLTVTCNRFLSRYPYGADNKPRFVNFIEPGMPWTSSAWALAALMGQSTARFGWPTRITDWQQIRLQDLAINDEDDKNPVSTEIFLTEDRIVQFISSGITPLVSQHRHDTAFIPAETTVAGESLSYQAIVTCVTQFIIQCRDQFPKALDPPELKQNIREALIQFFEKNGIIGTELLEISAGTPDADNRIPVQIIIKPARSVLLSGKKIEMSFYW